MCVQDALGVDAFNCSSEALVADALFAAYRSADEAAIRKLITSKPIFLDLDNQVNTLICQLCVCQFCVALAASLSDKACSCLPACLSVCLFVCACVSVQLQSSSV